MNNGYNACGCRDCFEIAIGPVGTMCHACVDAGCEGGNTECSAPGAYGGDEAEPPCAECERNRGQMAPSHNGSSMCESGSIASGGKRAHCTCDMCF